MRYIIAAIAAAGIAGLLYLLLLSSTSSQGWINWRPEPDPIQRISRQDAGSVAEQSPKDPVKRKEILSDTPSTQSSHERDSGERACYVQTYTSNMELIAGCVVGLRRAGVPSSEVSPVCLMKEVGEGIHRFSAIAPGRYDIICKRPAIDGSLGSVNWRGDRREDYSIEIGSRNDLIGGSVTLPNGSPVAGTVVTCLDSTAKEIYRITDSRGRFLFIRRSRSQNADSALFSVTNDAGGADISDIESTELWWGNLQHKVTATPRRPFTIRMRDEDGALVDAFSVQAETVTPYGLAESRASAEGGIAELANLPTGEARVFAYCHDNSLAPVHANIEVGPDGGGQITLRGGLGVRLVGEVHDASGAVVTQGATARLVPTGAEQKGNRDDNIRVRTMPPQTRLGMKRSANEGVFEFRCAPESSYRLIIAAEGYAPATEFVDTGARTHIELDVVLPHLHTLRVSLTPLDACGWLEQFAAQQLDGQDAQPFAIAQASLSPHATRAVLTAEASPSGVVEFRDVPAGEWLVWLRSPPKPELLRRFEMGSGGIVDLGVVDLSHLRPGSVVGQVRCVGAVSYPTMVRVASSGGGGHMDIPVRTDGSFSFAAPEATYTLKMPVSDAGDDYLVAHGRTLIVIAGESTSVDVDLAVQRCRVRLIDNTSGDPVAGVRISADVERKSGAYRPVTTDESGIAELFPCPLGEFSISMFRRSDRSWIRLGAVHGSQERLHTLRIPD